MSRDVRQRNLTYDLFHRKHDDQEHDPGKYEDHRVTNLGAGERGAIDHALIIAREHTDYDRRDVPYRLWWWWAVVERDENGIFRDEVVLIDWDGNILNEQPLDGYGELVDNSNEYPPKPQMMLSEKNKEAESVKPPGGLDEKLEEKVNEVEVDD